MTDCLHKFTPKLLNYLFCFKLGMWSTKINEKNLNREKQRIAFFCKVCISVGGAITDYKNRNWEELERDALHRERINEFGISYFSHRIVLEILSQYIFFESSKNFIMESDSKHRLFNQRRGNLSYFRQLLRSVYEFYLSIKNKRPIKNKRQNRDIN